jgi:hypothetical protein
MGSLVLNSSVLDKYFGILKDMDIDSKKKLIEAIAPLLKT